MLPYGIVPPREPLGTVDGKPVVINRSWWRFFENIFKTTGSGQGGDFSLGDVETLAFLELAPAEADRTTADLPILTMRRSTDSPAALVGNGSPIERRQGTDFDRVTADMRSLVMLNALRAPPIVTKTTLGLGTMATQNANAVAITGGTIDGTTIGATTPSAAVVTTLNGITVTEPATGATLTLLDGKTLTVNNSLTLAGTNATTITFQGTDTYVGRATTDTLTNKTLSSGTISGTTTLPGSGRIDPSGRLGLAITPNSWGGGGAIDLGFWGGMIGLNAGNAMIVSANAYYNGTNWIAKNTSAASFYQQLSGTHQWYTAASVTAGSSLTPVQAAEIDLSGNLINNKGVADQSYSYQTPATGFSITIGSGVHTLILDPSGTLATGTITMPASPVDGQVVRISSTQTITALTVSPNTGQTVKNAPTTLTVSLTSDQGYEFIYRGANTTWYRLQ